MVRLRSKSGQLLADTAIKKAERSYSESEASRRRVWGQKPGQLERAKRY